MKTFTLAIAALALLATPAAAHTGDHEGMTLSQLAAHIFETDHIVFAAIAVIVGVLSYRAGRRAEARAVVTARNESNQS